ncbi:MAG: hypothetical protein CVU05_02530 [Bacteroidetes bacterium HGW-Bacteroidetes-21]|jgi:predicted ATPase|nr:MAG: hypothetical protein CVU05_02530 [Bacteroidetes bacterium HGW-Bacteroidetes-21]
MNIKDLIEKDLPKFSGICVAETITPIQKVKVFGISLAWKFNLNKGKQFDKILIAAGGNDRGKYFIAEIKEILSVKDLYNRIEFKKAIKYHQDLFGDWITQRVNGIIKDNVLNERYAIIFEKASKIEHFSINDFQFNSNPVYYKTNPLKITKHIGENLDEIFEIRNIGKIKSARIKLNGLTVIAGINDTGKSTVGKLIFSIVKAISRYEQDLNESKEQIVFSKIEKLYFRLRRVPEFGKDEFSRDEFNPRIFQNQIKKLFETNQASIFPEYELEQLNKFFDYKQNLLLKYPTSIQQDCTNILLEIKKDLLSNENKNDQIKRALTRALFSEFQSEITPKGSSRKSYINYNAGTNQILEIEFDKNQISSLNLFDELMFKDVVYIETPLLLQMYDLIQSSDTLFESDRSEINSFQRTRPKVSLHIKDLISKIENAKYFSNTLFENNLNFIECIKNISTIIKGGFTFDKNNRDFIFSQKIDKHKNIQIKPANTASGIKSFGIIQLLLQGNMLNDKSLLIIDEPENHLHPQWQIEYAKMIIDLVRNDISVIISSHSPYIIQALKYYSELSQLKNKTSYYYAEIEDGETQSTITDVSNNLNIIFSKLAEPLKEIVWQ